MDRMTAEDFNSQETEILSQLPVELRSAASYYAYDRGHSAGREEVLSHLREFVSDFVKPILAYGNRCAKNGTNTLD